MKNRTYKGTTLIEVLVACSIFSFLLITLFAIIKFSLNNWRGIEDRSAVQAEIRKIQLNLMEDLTRSSSDSVVIANPAAPVEGAYRVALSFRTFIKGDGTATPADGTPIVNEAGVPQSQGYVLFMLLRPSSDIDEKIYRCTYAPDVCPHKMLVRVDLTKSAGPLDFTPVTGNASLSDYIPPVDGNGRVANLTNSYSASDYCAAITGTGDPSYVQNVYVVGKNIMSFQPQVTTYNSVKVTLKAFRLLEMGKFMQAGADLATEKRYTIQVNSEIFPMNTEIETNSPTPSPSST